MNSALSCEHQGLFDVAIIGGGLVGASLACATAQLGLKTAVLEAVQPRAASPPSFDDRTLALSASSCNILEELGIWPSLRNNATAIREVWVAELNRPGKVRLDSAELGLHEFGNVVEARVFGQVVMAMLPKLEGIQLLCPARLSGLEQRQDFVRVTYTEAGAGGQLDSRLVVGADGAGSMVRELLGIAAEKHDYGTTALIVNFMPGLPHAGRAFECFTPAGPLAVLPHVGGRCGLIWCVRREEAEGLLALEASQFLDRAYAAFTSAMGPVLGQFTRMGKRSSYPLELVRAAEDTRPRTVIMGNAAHAIHPIGAQGFNLGLRDIAVLTEVLLDATEGGADIGGAEVIRRYSEWRVTDHEDTIGWSDGLARLYANPSPVASAIRTAGLVAHALIPALRRRTTLSAMGFRGRIPRLAQTTRTPST